MTPLDPDLQKSADRDPDQGGKMIKNNNFLTKNIIFKSEPKKNRYLVTAGGHSLRSYPEDYPTYLVCSIITVMLTFKN